MCCKQYACPWKSSTSSGGASPLLVAGHRQVISHISKGIKNIVIYNFIITFDCQGGGISATFALVWCRHSQHHVSLIAQLSTVYIHENSAK